MAKPQQERTARARGTWRVALTGATGFIGSAVLGALARERDELPGGERFVIRVLGRRLPDEAAALVDEWVPVDLSDPRTVDGSCGGADVLLHLAAALGPDEERCARINVGGTAALAGEAGRAGVRRMVHLSTSAVYGPGPHRGIAVDEVAPAPASAASRTRLAAEEHALAAGAVVLRPGLVTGAGDRWVVPALARLLDVAPGLWDGGRGLLSMVDVVDLARLFVRLTSSSEPGGGTVWHASHPLPVRTGDLLASLAASGVLPEAGEEMPWEECLRLLRASRSPLSERQFALLARDHWYDSAEIWRLAACPPGPGPLARLDAAAEWYRSACSVG
ncbi:MULTISPECIES: NAD-dependent epimerase/dehydratase family protein [unclassified Streptomyces]|uniref:NAD-dependent epimerase/dehydratase family protein n=1 Tax=unclassified Streptomyces TaxID=2593676 RepID=UPI0006B05F63|nr:MULTISPECIES: NAD-dependent epimerase/dehydratase family protein [unclassified Streptomyces]KOX37811.1 autoregulator biosynthesis protein [Streptomyces sp. NRRL F-6491]KOX52299.1 autoregulator biosynthesis protein [Streptomyces sp. NRRL F-6492]